jgi:two-component system sensor histidine kinase KdpD
MLAKLQAAEPHARLRVYIDAAPGVGKTYSMIDDARAFRREGVDVVVGFVEAHGRGDTQARIGDLEVIPRRKVASWRCAPSPTKSARRRRHAGSGKGGSPR